MGTARNPRRTLALGGAALAALSLIAALPARPVSAAPPNACRVKNVESGRTFGSLQKAANVAREGHHLIVWGTCHGRTEILKDLSIKGRRTKRSGVPTLDGDRKGTVLTVGRNISVTVIALTVRHGQTTRDGGGIVNRGNLTLRGVVVRDNKAEHGGGVWTDPHGGTLVLEGSTIIKRNEAVTSGGGVDSAASLVVRGSARIIGNTAINGAGVVVRPEIDGTTGWATLEDSARISGNVASYEGGGIYVGIATVLTLEDDARISGNTAREGGGIFNAGGPVEGPGRVTLNGSSTVSGNEARYGGGIYNSDRCDLTLNGSSAVTANTATKAGGGVLSVGNLTMTGASVISDNQASETGGGLYAADDSVLTGISCGPGGGANVYGNTPEDCLIGSA
jgi:hypothetical protein